MIRLAIVVTDRKIWTGGYNYLLNLVEISSELLVGQISPVLFFADDVDECDVSPFAKLRGVEIVRSSALRQNRRARAVKNALILGVDLPIRDLFNDNRIDVIFEVAQFFGWRLHQPVVAWMADFQHRLLKHLFSKVAYWKRELGFQAEILSGRSIMLSSENARSDCERFYPSTRGRTYAVRFAVTARPRIESVDLKRIVDFYHLPDQFYFLPNQFWRHKNHECVIRALGYLKRLGCNVVVAASGNPLDRGDPGHWKKLEQLVEDLALTQNFRQLGMIPTDHLHALLQYCTALINPSMCEGWSTTVEEAKSAGTPMILSDLPVHREQATGSSVFFDPRRAEQLAEILMTYTPLDIDSRMRLASEAVISSQAAVIRYAQDFANVIGSVARGGSASR